MPHLTRSSVPAALIAISMLALAAGGAFALPADDTEKDLAKIRKRAEQGNTAQQFELATAYLTGKGVAQDSVQAAHWFLKAAEAGDPWSENQIGYMYLSGNGVSKDLVQANRWFQISASSGLVTAKVNLGVDYLYGIGLQPDGVMARQLFKEAADKGSGPAANYLGVMNQLGLGIPVDLAAARKWFELGVKLHEPKSAYSLACLYAGAKDRPDFRRAVELLRFAAGKDYVPAKHLLGLILVNHPEIAAPTDQPRQLLLEASNEGSWKASILLGVFARDGKGEAPNPSQAWYYFHLAALQGGSESRGVVATDLQALESKISALERAAVSQRAEDWFQQHRGSADPVVEEAASASGNPVMASRTP